MDHGYEGWDDYAPFYDWENARTLGKRDVPFWRSLALHGGGPVLELGCGTGRISLPLGRAGVPLVGIDRSTPMLTRARSSLRFPIPTWARPSPIPTWAQALILRGRLSRYRRPFDARCCGVTAGAVSCRDVATPRVSRSTT